MYWTINSLGFDMRHGDFTYQRLTAYKTLNDFSRIVERQDLHTQWMQNDNYDDDYFLFFWGSFGFPSFIFRS